MKRAGAILALASFTLVALGDAAKNPTLNYPPVRDPDKEGRQLAERLRTTAPAESTEATGVLKIRKRGQPIQSIAIASRWTVSATNWQVLYETKSANEQLAERFVVIHSANQPNVYFYTHQSHETKKLAGSETAIPLAGSDFWLCDLGLEFLHWTQQRLLKRETRKSRFCHVLESKPGVKAISGYSKVLSWIDAESEGVVFAEAYDIHGKLLKEFEVDKIEKVNGRWEIKRIEMLSTQSGSRTALEFDLNKK